MTKQIGIGILASKGFKPTLADLNESEHNKKVSDRERAIQMRKKAFGHDAVGDPVDQANPPSSVPCIAPAYRRAKYVSSERKRNH